MPKISVFKNLIFYIVSFDLSERLHLHIFIKNKNRNGSAKIWLDTLDVFDREQLTDAEINIAIKMLDKNKVQIEKNIEQFRKGKKSKPIHLK